MNTPQVAHTQSTTIEAPQVDTKERILSLLTKLQSTITVEDAGFVINSSERSAAIAELQNYRNPPFVEVVDEIIDFLQNNKFVARALVKNSINSFYAKVLSIREMNEGPTSVESRASIVESQVAAVSNSGTTPLNA